MSNELINKLVSLGLEFELFDLEISNELFHIAKKLRPTGKLINQKLTQYREINQSLSTPHQKQLNLDELNTSLRKEIKQLKHKDQYLYNRVNELHQYISYERNKSNFFNEDNLKSLDPVEIVDVGSKTTVIAFGGMATQLSLPPKEFFRSLMKHNVNILFIKDFLQCWYLKGLLGVCDTFEVIPDYLNKVMPANTQNVLAIGASAGGYAALKLSQIYSVKKVLALSPQIEINKLIIDEYKSINTEVDIEANLALTLTSETEYVIHYGKHNRIDHQSIKALPNLNNIKIISHDTDMHNIAMYLKKIDAFEKTLLNFLNENN